MFQLRCRVICRFVRFRGFVGEGENMLKSIKAMSLACLSLAGSFAQGQVSSAPSNGLVVHYDFENLPATFTAPASGQPRTQIPDRVGALGSDAAMPLEIHSGHVMLDSGVDNGDGFIRLTSVPLIRTAGAAKLVNRCRASNEFTIWMDIENNEANPRTVRLANNPTTNFAARILSFGSTTNAFDNRNFVFGQFYDGNSRFVFTSRNGSNNGADLRNQYMSEVGESLPVGMQDEGGKQRVVITRDWNGTAGVFRVYISNANRVAQIALREESAQDFPGSLSAWDAAYSLAIGNEPSFDPNNRGTPNENQNNRNWLGKLYDLRIYCRALASEEILGVGRAPFMTKISAAALDNSSRSSDARRKAMVIYNRVAGLRIPADSQLISQMETHVAAGNSEEAVKLAMDPPANLEGFNGFYNITVRDMAARMSTREESVNTPLNDFIATVIGSTKNNEDAGGLLTGNFFYMADPTLAAVPSDMRGDIVRSNIHYDTLQKGRFDLSKVLVRSSPQQLFDGNRLQPVINRDAAGLLTSRAFMEAHAIAGTNRRIIEYTFRQFLCIPIEEWKDANGSDSWVGRDIDRAPGGDPNRYRLDCKGCHTRMDPLRGAFARYTFSNGFVKRADLVGATPANQTMDGELTMLMTPGYAIASKLNHNEMTSTFGNLQTDDSFDNQAVRGPASEYFGWGARTKGNGTNQFGEMISQAKAFPRCMARRVFRAACKREPSSAEIPLLDTIADGTLSGGDTTKFKIKDLFKKIVPMKECIGTTFSEDRI